MTVRALARTLQDRLGSLRAQALIRAVFGFSKTDLILRADDEVDPAHQKELDAMLSRLESGEPIQYILGSWDFFGREFLVGEGVLIPRDDSEVALSAALEVIPPTEENSVLDLCSGSGILAITLKKERPRCSVTAVEKSPAAFSYLEKNREAHQAAVSLILSDLNDCAGSFSDESLDLIISNPPYIKTSDLPSLQKEVRFEPRMALDGGESGFDFFEMILRLYTKKLKVGGFFVFELGEDQHDALETMLKDSGFEDIRFFKDIQNTDRAVRARRREGGSKEMKQT